jgi:NADH oxidase (H2O2-forming)
LSNKNIVVIGCGAGGGTAAQFAKKTDRKANITIFEKGNYPHFSKCGLPYVISGKIKEFSELIEFSQDWFKKNNIDLHLNTNVLNIDSKNNKLKIKKGKEIFIKKYNSLIIATGAKPTIPPIKNIKNKNGLIEGIYNFRTIEDGKRIKSKIKKGKKAIILGAGLIGLEIADSLHRKNMDVTVIEALPSILSNTLDEDIATKIYDNIKKNVKIFTNHIITEIISKNGKIKSAIIKNKNNDEIKYLDIDILIIAIGTEPNSNIAKNAGCKISKTGHIIVNEKSETSLDNIYAAGDCTEYVEFITKKPLTVGLGSIVVRQAISAGINAAGGNYSYPKGIIQTRTTILFEQEIAAVGPTSKYFNDISFLSSTYSGFSLPKYYPGGKPITIKVIANSNNGRIIGAQAFGDKAAQRINTFACAILNEMNIETFRKLETAYAPPIAPTFDVETIVCDVLSMKLFHRKI